MPSTVGEKSKEAITPKFYFYTAVTDAIKLLGLSVSSWTEYYLVDVLTKRVSHCEEEEPLVFQLAKAKEARSKLEQLSLYKRAGDSALFLLGFFSDLVEKKGIQREYVAAMGGTAYSSAADLSPRGFEGVYCDLAEGFEEFAAVLDEVRESTSMHTPQDIVKLYDRWKQTKSKSAEDRLNAQGIFPLRRPTNK